MLLEERRAKISVEYHQFLVVAGQYVSPDPAELDDAVSTGLIAVATQGARVQTGTQFGDLEITVAIHDSEPPFPEGKWDVCVDFSLRTQDGFLLVVPLMDREPPNLGNLAAIGPGDYRLRMSARGRDNSAAQPSEREQYQLAVWPAPRAAVKVHFANDATSRSFGYVPAGACSDPMVRDQVRGCYQYVRGVLLSGEFDRSWGPCVQELQLDRTTPNPLGTAPTMAVNWLGIDGTMTSDTAFAIHLEPESDLAIVGTFLTATSADLRLTWNWALTKAAEPKEPAAILPSPTTVRLSLEPNRDGAKLTVTQDNLPFELVSPFSIVWSYYLDRLRLLAVGNTPPPHPWLEADSS